MVFIQQFGIVLCLASSFVILDVVANCDDTAAGGRCCNICRNGGQILNPDHEFDMIDTFRPEFSHRWSCGWLQTNLAAVNVGSTGAKLEARYCGNAQQWADRECECSGPPAPPVPANDPNGACDLCDIPEAALRRPDVEFENELVDTKIAGRMPCLGLYQALRDGHLPADICPIMQQNAGPRCCSLPSIGEGLGDILGGGDSDPSEPSVEEDTCGVPGDYCDGNGNGGCCPGFICRGRSLNGEEIKRCMPPSGGGAGRDRYTGGTGRGGAGGGRKLRKRNEEAS